MKKLTTTMLALAVPIAVLAGCATPSAPTGNANGTLMKAIVLSMGTDSATVANAQYDKYFKQGTAASGVPAIIAAGKFFINGYAIPASAAELAARYPKGYKVNEVPWLYYDQTTATWKGGYKGQRAAATYDAAALAVATGIVAGLEARLYDTDKDGYADLIAADFREGVIVSHVTRHADKTYRVDRGEIDFPNKTPNEGKLFDGPHFTATSGEVIKEANFDPAIAAGDIALFWYGTDGWVMQRAKEVNGVFVNGADHESYNIGGVAYSDAMRFSRDNLFISNRPGEFANAQKYFGLNNNAANLKVSLWLAPTTDAHAQGAPVGMTSNASARALLTKAIAIASARLASVAVSADGKDVPASRKWVRQASHSQLDQAIKRAAAAVASDTSYPAQLDYQIYLLYLTLNGSANDIGAKFGGYAYTGFENEIRAGSLAP